MNSDETSILYRPPYHGGHHRSPWLVKGAVAALLLLLSAIKSFAAEDAMSAFTINESAAARIGQSPDPVDAVTDELIHSIQRESLIFLIGPPGSGRLAHVRSLAQNLEDYEIYSLDTDALVNASAFRGQAEASLRAITATITDNPRRALYIRDFIKTMKVPTIAGHLASLIAAGQIKILGGLTADEYQDLNKTNEAITARARTILVSPIPDGSGPTAPAELAQFTRTPESSSFTVGRTSGAAGTAVKTDPDHPELQARHPSHVPKAR